ncbi:biliverdin-producing heme oxygenase [Aquabacterium sp.]|uniref:biliverdin-producing heme oxygenase n=1 Tax=Aquabacterium sp. TaxID=1872578 RepID=UPI0037851A12
MRTGTQDLHLEAERSGLMAALLQGRLSRAAYVGLLHNLLAIYRALEAGLAQVPPLPALPWHTLQRGPALARDLACLRGADAAVLVPAAEAYVERLHTLAPASPTRAAARPELLLAHAYVRYLGDLHGGQILRRCTARLLGTTDGDGLDFYDFGPPDQVAMLIGRFRAGLDALVLPPERAQAVVAESRWAFEQHVRLFRELPH